MKAAWGLLVAAHAAAQYAGSAACTPCHAEIVRRYSATAMARSAGPASAALPAGEVRHPVSGARFTITALGSIRYERGPARGALAPAWFIGSGHVGRSYLWSRDGYLFQLPIGWYATKGWDVAPGYESHRDLSLARPIEPDCLNCHASGLEHRAGTQNGYADPPFREGGVSCERCHGPGAEHARTAAPGAIVNPARLAPARRDSVCAQCHLTGVERVERAGRALRQFRPGDDFDDYAAVFLWDGPDANGLHVASHGERLEASGCKKGAGEKLWCGSCHDAHTRPAAADRETYFRSRCMTCHEGSAHARGASACLGCHMPANRAADAVHTTFTDHSIPRRTPKQARPGNDLRLLRGAAGPREWGLAWARVANASQRGDHFGRARKLLQQAWREGARDGPVATMLGYLEDRAGNGARAMEYYQHAPPSAEVLMNIGSEHALAGRLDDALAAWRRAANANPGLEMLWVKIASALGAQGRIPEAVQAAREELVYRPDSPRAREMLRIK